MKSQLLLVAFAAPFAFITALPTGTAPSEVAAREASHNSLHLTIAGKRDSLSACELSYSSLHLTEDEEEKSFRYSISGSAARDPSHSSLHLSVANEKDTVSAREASHKALDLTTNDKTRREADASPIDTCINSYNDYEQDAVDLTEKRAAGTTAVCHSGWDANRCNEHGAGIYCSPEGEFFAEGFPAGDRACTSRQCFCV